MSLARRSSCNKMAAAALVLLLGLVAAADATGQRLSEAERRCLRQTKVLFPGDNKCYRLMEKGPCPQGQLLYIDDSNLLQDEDSAELKLKPVCRPCRCCDKGTTAVFWSETGECLLRGKDGPTYCPAQGTELQSDVFGEGECACRKGHARLARADDSAAPRRVVASASAHRRRAADADRIVYSTDTVVETLFFRQRRASPADGGWVLPDDFPSRDAASSQWGRPQESRSACWPLFTRGPCSDREVLFPGGACRRDPCLDQNRARGRREEAYVPVDGRCAQLGSNCTTDSKLKAKVELLELSGEPACVEAANLLHLVNPPLNCPVNADGDCEKQVDVPKNDDNYYKLLLNSLEKKRRKRRTGQAGRRARG